MSKFSNEAQKIKDKASLSINVATIQQQLLQMETINILSKSGYLDKMVLQGGAAISGGYGGKRLSNDLDFNCRQLLTINDIDKINKLLSSGLSKRFATDISIKAPTQNKLLKLQDEKIPVIRWYIKALGENNRPDLGRIVLKVEVAIAGSLTAEMNRYKPPLPFVQSDCPLIQMESKQEIIADKIVSFAFEKRVLRIRDLWDLLFLLSLSTEEIDKLEIGKMAFEKARYYNDQLYLAREFENSIELYKRQNGHEQLFQYLKGTLIDFPMYKESFQDNLEKEIDGVITTINSILFISEQQLLQELLTQKSGSIHKSNHTVLEKHTPPF